MTFDMLYVLSRGGVCIFSGRPQNLRSHLNECHINCDENQIPIELLLKISSNGFEDQIINQLSEKTREKMGSYSSIVSQVQHISECVSI